MASPPFVISILLLAASCFLAPPALAAQARLPAARTGGTEKAGSSPCSVSGYREKNCPFQIPSASGSGRTIHTNGTSIQT